MLTGQIQKGCVVKGSGNVMQPVKMDRRPEPQGMHVA
jgi:hypothetical protein